MRPEAANASSSALQLSPAKSVVQTSPQKSPPKRDVRLPTSPQKPSAKLYMPHTENTCVVTIDKLTEEDVQKSGAASSPAKQSVQSSAATNAVSEKTKTVANVSQSSSTARQSTSTSNIESEVEISDESDTDSFGIDTLANNYWLPSSKWAKRHGVRKPWSDLEEEMVYKGVKAHGVGNWALIRSNFLRRRSNVDIKDKWRTMIRQGRLKELTRKFGPLELQF